MTFERSSQQAFFGASALLFAASATLTAAWCGSMSGMGGMSMPGGWTMSMAWMRMPGQTWLGAAASFVGMWVVMMAAMMLPSLVPALWRFRQALSGMGEKHPGWLTTVAGLGYFFVWAAFGVAIFPPGVGLAAVEMRREAVARIAPIAAGAVVMIAGALQFSPWKTQHLVVCGKAQAYEGQVSADAGTAWRQGLRLGLNCCRSCANLTAILLVVGIMDLRAMAVVTIAITLERFAPARARVARGIGVAVVGCGLYLLVRGATGVR